MTVSHCDFCLHCMLMNTAVSLPVLTAIFQENLG